MLSLRFHPKALKELATLPPKHFRQVVGELFALMDNPMPNDVRQLKGIDDPMFRVSSRECRIAYRFTETDLFIEAVGARNDDAVYRTIMRRE